MKEYSGSDGIAPLILNSASRPSHLTTGEIAHLGIEMDAGWFYYKKFYHNARSPECEYPNKYGDFHIHMDYVILYGSTEGK